MLSFRLISPLLLALGGALASTVPRYAAPPSATCPETLGPAGVTVRIPPALQGNNTSSAWSVPPAGWYFKPWNMFFTTNAQVAGLRNFQYDPTPVDATNMTGEVHDLSSFQVPNNDTVFTSYGVDTWHPRYPFVLDYVATGIIEGASSQYSVLAWGCDAAGEPYYANYATYTELTKTPAGIDIMSTSEKGPDQATADAIIKGLKGVAHKEIARYADALLGTTRDSGRDGLSRVTTCDNYCKSNQDLMGLLG